MKKNIYTKCFIPFLILVFLVLPVSGFTTPKGNEVSLIWGTKTITLANSSLEWVARVDYPNGTTIYGHFERVYHNYYNAEVPTIIGLNFNGVKYYRNRYIRKSDDSVSFFKVPIGDRNMKEYGKCRQYEIDKGVCSLK